MRTRRHRVWVGALCAVLAAAGAARAEDVDRARQFFTLGAQAYDKGDFVGAVEAFEEAQRLAPRSQIVFALAQAHRRAFELDRKPDDLRAAVRRYREYLAQAPTGDRRREAVEALASLEATAEKRGIPLTEAPIAAAEKRKTRLSVMTSPPGGMVSVDGGPAIASPKTLDVTPGKHTVTATLDGHAPGRAEVDVADGDTGMADVKMAELPALLEVRGSSGARVEVDGRPVGTTPTLRPVPVTAGTHLVVVAKNGTQPFVREMGFARGEVKRVDATLPATGQRVLATGLLVTSAVGVVGGGIFMGVALAEESRAVGIRDARGVEQLDASDLERYEGARSARDAWTAAALTTWGVSGALAISGALLWLFDSPRVEAPPVEKPKTEPTAPPPSFELKAAPSLSPTVVGATLVGRF